MDRETCPNWLRDGVQPKNVRQVTAATYCALWWPSVRRVVYAGDRLRMCDEEHAT